jgi:ATP-dependent RNA helicase DeaD
VYPSSRCCLTQHHGRNILTEIKTFSDLGLSAELLEAINKKGFEEPTAIQSMTIPVMLANKSNIIAQAQTGTGKTAAFGLPLIQMVDPSSSRVQALVLVPTRELAIQVSEEINSLRGARGIRVVPIYGGQSIDQQLRRLKRGIHIVVGTPGRVIDHLNRKTLDLAGIDHLILDEADEMLNMGFIEDMEEIMRHTNPEKRTLLFSATMPPKILQLARDYMEGYELLAAKKEQLTTALTEQIYFEVKMSDKFDAMCRIIDMEETFYGLIFCRTKIDVDTVTQNLTDRGYDAEALHGDISQAQRERTLNKFKQKKVNILVATDVAARGIDVIHLTHVINYSLPQDPDAYVHRIGRTGRAGNEGTAITFITPSEYKRLMFIQRVTRTDIKKSKLPEVEDILQAKRKKIDEDLEALRKETVDQQYYNWAKQMLNESGSSPTEIVASLLSYSFEEDLNPDNYGDIQDVSASRRQNDRSFDRNFDRQLDRQGTTRLFVALGRKDRISPRQLIDLLVSKAPVKPKQIGDIQIMENFSFVIVPFFLAEKIVAGFRDKGRRPLVTHARKDNTK